MPAAASRWPFSLRGRQGPRGRRGRRGPRGRQGLRLRPRRAVGAPLGPLTVRHAQGKAPANTLSAGRGSLSGHSVPSRRRPTAAEPSGSGAPPRPRRRQNRTPGERTPAQGRGEGGYAGRSFEGGRVRFAFGEKAPPLWRHGSAFPLPLHGAARAHSFRAGPARHLRAPSAARRRHNVGPRRRDTVCHPDLPVRGARGEPPPAPRLPLWEVPRLGVPASAEPVTSGSHPPAAAGMLLRCHRAGSLPARRRAGLQRISWAAPRSRRPFARGSGGAPFPGRGSERGPPRPAQLRPTGCLSMPGPHPRSH